MELQKPMLNIPDSLEGRVGLFFVADTLLLYVCALEQAETYGDFLIFPGSHAELWEREHQSSYGVDYDFYPRGRFAFNTKRGVYLLYHDRCIARAAKELRGRFPEGTCRLALDEHYQCAACNPRYVR
jgi:hypothetical protein